MRGELRGALAHLEQEKETRRRLEGQVWRRLMFLLLLLPLGGPAEGRARRLGGPGGWQQ